MVLACCVCSTREDHSPRPLGHCLWHPGRRYARRVCGHHLCDGVERTLQKPRRIAFSRHLLVAIGLAEGAGAITTSAAQASILKTTCCPRNRHVLGIAEDITSGLCRPHSGSRFARIRTRACVVCRIRAYALELLQLLDAGCRYARRNRLAI